MGQTESNKYFPLSYNSFMNHKIFRKYISLDFKMVVKLMKKYDDIHVIVDVKIHSNKDSKILYKKRVDRLRSKCN